MKPKHTPGPFVLGIAATDGCDLKGRRDWQGRIVAPSEPDDFGRSKTVIAGTAALEDWHLFAAAPELLAVAKSTLDLFEALAPVFQLLGDDYNAAGFERVRETIKLVIAKAEGEE